MKLGESRNPSRLGQNEKMKIIGRNKREKNERSLEEKKRLIFLIFEKTVSCNTAAKLSYAMTEGYQGFWV